MSEKIALIGFVNTEEVLADTIRRQSPEVQIDGYEVFPNEAFGRIVDNRHKLYGTNEAGEFGLHNLEALGNVAAIGYSAINVGPITAADVSQDILKSQGLDYVGPKREELEYEIDKTLITEIFPEGSGILPPTRILESSDTNQIKSAIDSLGGEVVLKFVGEYPKYYSDSETRRVRMLDEFTSPQEVQEFVSNSIAASGKVVLQKKVSGQQFSYTALVDGKNGLFRLGENICYKNRYDGDLGPLCDGTGSVSVNNTLPGILSSEDIEHIEKNIVQPYTQYLEDKLGAAPKTFLNIDLIKDDDGRLFLLEVNNRQPGGHTMADLLSGLETPLFDILQATQEGRLSEIERRVKPGATIAVSAYPNNFPMPFEDPENRPVVTIPKLKLEDKVRMYTGWVDVEDEDELTATVRTHLSPTMLFVNHDATVQKAAQNVYERIGNIVPAGFDYRRDIGKKLLVP